MSLSDSTPFRSNTEFDMRVRHASGETTVRVRPQKSREFGVFTLDEGRDGFVEIHAGNSKELATADAVVFEPEQKPPTNKANARKWYTILCRTGTQRKTARPEQIKES